MARAPVGRHVRQAAAQQTPNLATLSPQARLSSPSLSSNRPSRSPDRRPRLGSGPRIPHSNQSPSPAPHLPPPAASRPHLTHGTSRPASPHPTKAPARPRKPPAARSEWQVGEGHVQKTCTQYRPRSHVYRRSPTSQRPVQARPQPPYRRTPHRYSHQPDLAEPDASYRLRSGANPCRLAQTHRSSHRRSRLGSGGPANPPPQSVTIARPALAPTRSLATSPQPTHIPTRIPPPLKSPAALQIARIAQRGERQVGEGCVRPAHSIGPIKV